SAGLCHEDISLRDTIPLIPLQQLLSRGVSLVVPMLGVLVVAIALYALNVWAEGVVAKVATDALGQAAKLDEKARKSIEKADWGVVANALKTARDATEDDDHRTALGRARRRVLLVHFSQNVVFSVLFFVLAFFVPPVPAAALV